MGYIYGIENIINHKWYVGQSIYYPKERWRMETVGYEQHNMAISKAIKKYGVENFTFNILEEIENDKLDEREIYWIKEKDSFLHGYNSTRGGKPSTVGYRIKYDMQEIVDYYQSDKHLSCRDVAKHFGIFHETVSTILKEFNIPIRNGKKYIILKNGEEVYEFYTYANAADFLIENGYTTLKRDQVRKNILPYKNKIGNFEIIRG